MKMNFKSMSFSVRKPEKKCSNCSEAAIRPVKGSKKINGLYCKVKQQHVEDDDYCPEHNGKAK